ncbi:MAG TPA: TIGR03435 family protein [Bryobacteraceae bacterium]|nr:TIGR03435 family protein [Bryobacteraceae bacterium]
MKTATAALASLLFVFGAAPQNRSLARPEFDVASVKECAPGKSAQSATSPGRLTLGCWSLRTLIQQAYDVFASGKSDPLNPGTPTLTIEGLPGWANTAMYSIEATVATPQTAAMMRGPMMQVLLEARFQLKLHREQREVPAWLMTVDPAPRKLHEARANTCEPYDFSEAINMVPSGQIFCGVPSILRRGPLTILDIHGITLQSFAKSLHPDGRPVVDRTGLGGRFDIHLEWGADDPNTQPASAGVAVDPSPHATVIEAMREQLGLRLTTGRAIGEFLVVDHIEKASGN